MSGLSGKSPEGHSTLGGEDITQTGGGGAFPGFGAAPGPVTNVSSAGVAGTASRSDHVHALFGVAQTPGLVRVLNDGLTPAIAQLGAFAQARADGIATGTVQLSTLSAAASTGLVDGSLCWVATVGDFFILRDSSALTTTATTVIAASGRVGAQWLRIGVSNPAFQVQTAWFIDAQNVAASDENTGLTALAPLKTFQEVARRVRNAVWTSAPTFTVNSDCLNTDKADFSSVSLLGNVNPFVKGTPATPIYTGTITTWTPASTNPAADDNELNDTGIPVSYTASGLLASGLIYKRINGTVCYWWPLKDLGAKTLRTTLPGSISGSTVVALAPGDTYTVSQLPKIFGLKWAPAISKNIVYQFVDNQDNDAQPVFNALYQVSQLSGNKQWNGGTFGNCFFKGPTSWSFGIPAGGFTTGTIQMGGFVGTGASVATAAHYMQWILGQVSFQGALWNQTDGGNLRLAGRSSWYDCTGVPLTVNLVATALFASDSSFGYGLGGKGNTSQLLLVGQWGKIAYVSATPPVVAGSTSAVNQVQISSTAHPITDLPLNLGASDQGIFQTDF